MIAIDLLRPPLRHAAERAAQCTDAREGRHLVRLAIDAAGHGHDVELVEAPEGTSPATEACIDDAFAREAYPSLAPPGGTRGRPVGTIRVSFPFVVTRPPETPSPDHP